MLNRSKVWAVVLLLAAFVAGIAVGVGAQSARRGPRPSYVDRLSTDLALTPAQRDSVAAILERYDDAMHELWNEVRPRMDTIRLDIRERIMTVLTPDQQEAYRALTQRIDSVRAAREGQRDR